MLARASGSVDATGSALVARPLAPASGPRGATLFTPVPAERSGVVAENKYADPRMWGERYDEFSLGSVGTGVTVGDYDNDGRPDLFVVSKTESCRLFRNLGGWKFADVTAQAGLAASGGMLESGITWLKSRVGAENAAEVPWQQGAAFADVNNDGWLDLYVCRMGAPNQLFINQRDGTFKEEAAARGLAVVDASTMAAFCDYDRDGWLDVYVQTSLLDAAKQPKGRRDHLFHNNRDGTFTEVTYRAGIRGETLGHSATWWDYDEDGWPDLYVANDFEAPDNLYHNNRDGTFTDVAAEVLPHAPYSAMGSDLGDVNNDGHVDFFVADMAATTHEKDHRGMAYSRLQSQDRPDAPGLAQYSHNALYLNTGVGRMQEAAFLAGLSATDWTWAVRLEDLDNDGRLDLYVTNGMTREFQNADLRDRLTLAESPAERIRLVKSTPVLAERHLAFRNTGDLKFEPVGAAWGLDQAGVAFGAAFADFDGDGDLDLVYGNYEGGVTLLRNDSDTGHRLVVELRGTQSNRFGVGATVRVETAAGPQVRPLVLARGYLSTSEPVLHFGLGAETRVKRLTVSWPSGAEQVFADVAADARVTITEPAVPAARPGPPPARVAPQFAEVGARLGLARTVRERPGEEPLAQPLLPMRQNRRGPAAAVGDLDGDGIDDLVLGGTPQDPLQVLRGGEAGAPFAPAEGMAPGAPSPLADGPILVFDADGDGANDIFATRSGTGRPAGSTDYQPRLLLNDGHGRFASAGPAVFPALPISAGALAAVDFNRDGQLDVFVGGRVRPGQYPQTPRSALLANHGGKFEDVTERLAPGLAAIGMVTAARWLDVDDDGWPDLLVAVEWGGVRYWHNNAGQGFDDRSAAAGFSAAGTGWWTSLAAADFNGDGRLDIVAGNVGLNTQYKASPDQPALLFHGSFPGASPGLLLEAYYEDGKLYPWRTRNELAARWPAIRKRFPHNDAYAKATLEEIVGAEHLAQAKRLAATELRSGVFLSQPDGTYRFEPLPRAAQLAPLDGIVAGDFDGDGLADIYALQNSHAPAGAGRFDGGVSQLLRGDGRGHFTVVPPAESGLVVAGDAKALAVLDLDRDGWPDFLATRNNDSSLAFRNEGVAGRRSMRVELRGRPGNPTAIGAKVVLELTDGRRETADVAAGSGYFSQSSGACFFGYPATNPPRRLEVRWPDGRITEQAGPFPGSAVVAGWPP